MHSKSYGENLENIFLIVGLGNPDKKYSNTYHNIGFMTVDLLCEKINAKTEKKQCFADVKSFKKNDKKIIVAKPLTYMNLSGNSLIAFKKKHKFSNDQILVIADDIDLPVGKFRFRQSGSGGTHNGLKSIVNAIGNDFQRIRIGIGKPEDETMLADYVLDKIPENKKQVFLSVTQQVVEFILKNILAKDEKISKN